MKLRNQNSKLETKTCRKQKEFAKEREPVDERNCESIGVSRSAKWRPRKKQKISAKRWAVVVNLKYFVFEEIAKE